MRTESKQPVEPRDLLQAIRLDRRMLVSSALPPAYLERGVEAGIGPLLFRLIDTADRRLADLLLASELGARALTDHMLKATEEILEATGSAAAELILLKGIAVCKRHYPEPHLRTMGDIDLLAPAHLRKQVQSALRELGYCQESVLPARFFDTHHHLMPFFHPQKQLWVELHGSLFPQTSRLSRAACFSNANVLANTVGMRFGSIETKCLIDELHLIYTCAHWGKAFNVERGLIPIIDVLYLLHARHSLDWDRIASWLADGSATSYVGLMLGYLLAREVFEPGWPSMAQVMRLVREHGKLERRLLYKIIDSYLVGRRPFGRILTNNNIAITWDTLLRNRSTLQNLSALPGALLFPPKRPDRFRPALALRRVRSFFRTDPERAPPRR